MLKVSEEYRVYFHHAKPVYKKLFKDMKHMGFSDAIHNIQKKSMIGKLDPEVIHENLSKCNLVFFKVYLKGIKEKPELKNNGTFSVSVYQLNM